ncbi:E3 ubiquitin-protein ligase RFWD3-like [Drosophila rhopaloa]|uniref:E3 ubiquitin-protein ligase RFWD3-like n=1 Tax=Drosophila rhopaloa TaxID=1041015 RepID=A0A6P4EEC7_DRORH|nr:E3 ubiquitin-protein ligase RFWD3-like [Drosophila rhopaloa]
MNPEQPKSEGSSLSHQMKQNFRKMNDLVEELQQEKQKVASLQHNAGRNQQLEEHNASLEQRVRQLELRNEQLEEFNSERIGILQQLQQEMCNYATIQEKFEEEEQSMQLIVRELELDRQDLLDELTESTGSIEDLNEEVNELNQQLNGMSEDINCSICLSPWESEGGHRLVSLRCGHLFGNKCIRTVLRQSHRCPICNKWAHHADVRKIYGLSVLPS